MILSSTDAALPSNVWFCSLLSVAITTLAAGQAEDQAAPAASANNHHHVFPPDNRNHGNGFRLARTYDLSP